LGIACDASFFVNAGAEFSGGERAGSAEAFAFGICSAFHSLLFLWRTRKKAEANETGEE
jgi:hypothetical protein